MSPTTMISDFNSPVKKSLAPLLTLSLISGMLLYWGFFSSSQPLILTNLKKFSIVGVLLVSGCLALLALNKLNPLLLDTPTNLSHPFMMMMFMPNMSTSFATKRPLLSGMLSVKNLELGWLEGLTAEGLSSSAASASALTQKSQALVNYSKIILSLILVTLLLT